MSDDANQLTVQKAVTTPVEPEILDVEWEKSFSTEEATVLPPSSSLRTILAGLVIIGVTFFGAGIWAATAPIASAVTAQGLVVVIGKQRSIQHLEGGIIGEIRVREGDMVQAGDTLFLLDPTAASANVARLQTQRDNQLAIRDRLNAERTGSKTITFDRELLENVHEPVAAKAMAVQTQEFIERRKTIEGTIEVLEQRIDQLNSRIEGFNAQKEARRVQLKILDEEIEVLSKLTEEQLVSRSRVLLLMRQQAEVAGDIGNIDAQIAGTREQIGETNLQIIQIQQEARETIVALLSQTEAQIADLGQQLSVAKDVLKRGVIKAPISGIVQDLNISTIGGVISPGETLMKIAPASDDFLIEAQVSPLDIDKVSLDQEAEIRFSALDLRSTPSIFGNVVTKSGDRVVDTPDKAPYYRIQIKASAEELGKLEDNQLQAGMPAEVLIKTKDRTLLNYLAKPLTDAISRGLTEE